MKHTAIFSLPALLRPAVLLAAASQNSFSVGDDLFAHPQYEVRFSEDWVSDELAQSRLDNNGQQSESPASEVEHYRPSDQQPSSEDSKKREEKFLYEKLNLEGQPYLCSIPQVSKPEAGSAENDTLTKLEQEKELARANERGWELLSGMQGQCVYFISGWWSYKFCFNDGVRQFHQLPPGRGTPVYPPVEDSEVPGFTLGAVKKEDKEVGKDEQGKEMQVGKKADGKPLGELVQRGDSTYLLQRLEGGTICDLTRKPRRIDVQFHCNPSPPDRISLIKEISTCAYLMVIQTPRLCKDVAFLPPEKDQPNPILCSPVLSSEQDINDYERDMAALKQAEAEVDVWAAEPEAAKIFLGDGIIQGYPVVGDIAIGARNIVPEGVTIEKSAVVGGKGDETYIDTIASSDGRVLTKEELEKLGLVDMKSVERLRKQLEQYAKGQEWKLDVVETAGGRREYRGVIGSEEDEEGMGEKDGEGEGGGQDGGEGKEGEEGSEEEYYKEEL